MDPAVLIRTLRRRQGLTQAQLADRAGTSQPVISAYERGLRDPGFHTLRKLVEAGGERLELGTRGAGSDLPAAADLAEHGRRLLDVLSLVDAIPVRARSAVLHAPRLASR